MQKNDSAQGAIEYLVIVATVIVISLIAVVLFISFSDSSSQEIRESSSKIGGSVVGGISIVESVVDSEGDSLIKLNNNSSDTITLKKISVGDVDNNYDSTLVGLDSKVFGLSGLGGTCPCASGQKSVKCELRIQYLTTTGIMKTDNRTVTLQCVNNATPTNPGDVIDAIDTDAGPPVVSLSSPEDRNIFSGRDLVFSFSAIDDGEIDSCILHVGSDSNIYYNLNNGENTITYTKLGDDGLFDWNVECSDGSNYASSESRQIVMDVNSLQIASCIELQDINKNLSGSYELMNDVDCGYDTNNSSGRLWNNGKGFKPIGSSALNNYFIGQFNGNNYTVYNLYINDSSLSNVGLFGYVSGYYGGVKIKNLHLVDVNVIGGANTGGIIGNSPMYDSNVLKLIELTNCSASGNVRGTSTTGGVIGFLSGVASELHFNGTVNGSSYVGGLVGHSVRLSRISQSSFEGNAIGTGDYIGGLVGNIGDISSTNDVLSVSDSYSTGTVQGVSRIGGLIGYSYGGTIMNSFSSSNVIGGAFTTDYAGGLVGYNYRADFLNSYSSGTVLGYRYVGGFGGSSSGLITNSYSSGNSVTGNSVVGGFVGMGSSTITNVFSGVTNVSGVNNTGGLVGSVMLSPTVVNSFYTDGNVNGRGTKISPASLLYAHDGSNHAVYYGAPNWDGNWVFRDDGFPILGWQD